MNQLFITFSDNSNRICVKPESVCDLLDYIINFVRIRYGAILASDELESKLCFISDCCFLYRYKHCVFTAFVGYRSIRSYRSCTSKSH